MESLRRPKRALCGSRSSRSSSNFSDRKLRVANASDSCGVPTRVVAPVVAVVVDRGAGVNDPGYSMFLKPVIETFLGIFRQCAFRRKPNGFFHQNAHRREFENGIRHSGHAASNSPKN